ncbi:peptidoglycan DD-metalloendopeptidase family protein [Massilia sp. W12]|uniref:M23 family metallopeptidase n=1 Tax=Massilia sp. W12 TaxID=3126507 RepID=UPI0030CCDBC7
MNPLHKFLRARTGSAPQFFSAEGRKTRIVAGSALGLTLLAFGAAGVAPLAPDAANLPVKTVAQELALPDLSSQLAALEQDDQRYIQEQKIRSGDTLGTLLTRLGVDDQAASSFIKSDKTARTLMQMRAGRHVQAEVDSDGQLLSLRASLDVRDGPAKTLRISRVGEESFKAEEIVSQLERRVEMKVGEIRSSLFAATDSAQVPDAVAQQLAEMFRSSIDFASDLRRGDRFMLVYETFWQDGEPVRSGRILAAEFHNAGKLHQAVWFDDPSASQGGGYYDFDGKSLKKAFLKSPVAFTRISSGFSMRVHPISGQWKAHKGVDMAAAMGTPILAAGDGVVETVGSQSGYGNMIILKHWDKYSTVYAHMSRFADGMRKGRKVSQGEVIGYVGMTGWATGPHLHYEFRVNNEPRNPLALDMPNAQPLNATEMARFKAVAGEMSHRFALLLPEAGSGSPLKLAQK